MMLDASESVDATDVIRSRDQVSSTRSGPVTLLLNVNSPRMKIVSYQVNADAAQGHTRPGRHVDRSTSEHFHHNSFFHEDSSLSHQPPGDLD